MTNYKIHLTSFLLLMAFVGSSMGILAQSNSAQMGQEYAKTHIIRKSFELQLSDRDVEAPVFTDAYQSKHNGVFHVYLKQAYEQIPVYNATMNLNMDKTGDLLSIHSQFVPQLEQRVNTTQPSISSEKAVQLVAAHLALDIGEVKVQEENLNIPQKTTFKQNDFLRRNVVVSQVFYALEENLLTENTIGNSVRLAWNVDISIKDPFDSYEIQVDAIDGTILNKISKTHHCSFDHNGNHSADCSGNHSHSNLKEEATTLKSNSMMPPGDYSYNIFDFPLESPAHGGRSIVTTPWTNAGDAGTLGWHNDGSTLYDITRGNNVWARHNVDANNFYSPLATSNTEFDYPFNETSTLDANQDAAITNLFYTNNMMHDVWYQYGFDEGSGNFQNDNLQRGGTEGDYVIAGAQDLTGTNNALFDTPADGLNPEMQMFIWYYSEIVKLEIEAPSPDAGVYTASTALFGDRLPLTPGAVTGELVLVENLDSTNTTINTGCSPLSNAGDVAGNIALIDRGGCFFIDKVREAQAAGAIACVVCNNEPGSPFVMSGDAPDITIPSLMVGQSVCDAIKANANAVNVSMYSTREELSYDASFDNGVVSHEYGHGISMRLTGGPGNVACLGNSEQMGEGWSDWMGLWMTMEAGDTGTDSRGMGTYVNGEDPTGDGLRLRPYSTDLAVNGYTYEDLCNAEVLAPHGVGFIWGTMLWDLTWALVDEYGFDPDLYNGFGGNNLAAQLIIDGMKLQPCSPGFVDGRDAILLADDILTGGANYCLIWDVFARRGLGYSTIQGSSFNRCDQVAAFDTPTFCSTFSMIKEIDTDEVNDEDVVIYTIAGINNTGGALDNVTITDTLSNELTYVNNSSDCPVSINGQILSYNVGTLNDGEGFQCSFQAAVNISSTSQIEFFDGAEGGLGNWDTTDLSGNGHNWAIETIYPYEESNSYRVIAPAEASDQALTMKQPVLVSGANPMLIFRHFYITELRWDFGRVEISTNNGTTWDNLGSKFISNGYNDVIDANSTTGYANQAGFTGNSGGYIMSIADLSLYNGQSVLIRFRMITDDFIGDDGWLIDNITIADAVTLDNVACLSSDQVQDCAEASAIVAGTVADVEARLQVKALLQGAINSSNNLQMNATLSNLGLVPQLEPYDALPAFQHYGGGGGETISSPILGIVGNNSIVDWVMIELRSKTDPTIILETKSALLTQNGTIVDGVGDNILRFDVPNDDYYVAIRHRNHLGLMTANPVYVSDNNSNSVPMVDFTDSSFDCFGNNGGYVVGSVRTLWSGNVRQEGNVIFQGMDNVPNEIFFKILTDIGNTQSLLNYIVEGYDIHDLNLDGQVIYQGVNNDPNVPFFNVLLNDNNPENFSNFVVEEQLPENQ